MKIENVLATKGSSVHTIGPEESIREALRQLAEHNVGALVVTGNDGLPTGILSERDITRSLATSLDVVDQQVRDLMTRKIVTGSPSDDVDAVLQTMTNAHFRHLPVVQDGHLVGIVTTGDLVKARLADMQGTVETLETQLLNSN